MKTYLTLITISGLKRADLTQERKAIGEGEVIELPDGFAKSLLATGAIEPSDADVTVQLHWDRPARMIKSNDAAALRDALIELDPDFGSRAAIPTSLTVLGPSDHQLMAQALEAAGATVVLAGEEWPVNLMKVDQPLLLAEVARRIGKGEIEAAQLPEEVLGLAGMAFSASLQDLAGKIDPAIVEEVREATEKAEAAIRQVEQETPAPVDPAPIEPAPAKTAKPARKRA